MRKLLVFLCVAGLLVSLSSPLMAGGIDNKTAWSAEYIRTFNRNAATDSADAAAYNPAGVMKMEDGVYGNLSVIHIGKDYTNEVGGLDLDSDEPSIVPGLFALYKQDRWAAFFAFTITGGGGYVDYKDGNYTTSAANALINLMSFGVYDSPVSHYLEAESYYYGYTIGGAYKINDIFSVSLGARLSDAYKEAKGSTTINSSVLPFLPPFAANIDYEEDADGWCGIIGVNISPNEDLNIGIRYESKTELDFKQKVKRDDQNLLPYLGVNDGAKVGRDLPALLGLGASYKFSPKIRVETNFTLYLNNDAGWKDTSPLFRDPGDVDNGYDLGITIEYTFNDKLKGSLGYLHTDTGIDAENMLPEAPELDAETIAAGVAYEAMPGMILNFAISNSFYDEDSFVSSYPGIGEVEYDKNNFILAFGVQYKFM